MPLIIDEKEKVKLDRKKKNKKEQNLKNLTEKRKVVKNYENELKDIAKKLDKETKFLEKIDIKNNRQETLLKKIDDVYGYFSKKIFVDAPKIAKKFIEETSNANKEKMQNQIKKIFGLAYVDIVDSNKMQKIIDEAIKYNASLIVSIPDVEKDKIADAVLKSYKGDLDKPLIDRIMEIKDMTKTRAAFIARDQSASLISDITSSRASEIGCKEYTWITARDSRVVGNPSGKYRKGNKNHGNHWIRHNKSFPYNKPPTDGNAGKAIGCRCIQAPIVDVENLNLEYK